MVSASTAVKLGGGLVLLLLIILLCFWAGVSRPGQPQENGLTIVTTFTILEDLVRNVAGDDADVRNITPAGAEVHEWELVPANFADLEQADVVFYNGLNLEQWVGQITASVRPGVPVVALGERCAYPTLPIATGGLAGDPDPHIWMHPEGAAAYVEAICAALSEVDPSGISSYRERADIYGRELRLLHRQLASMFSEIPPEKRLLITTEAAFTYLASAYGFTHGGIWGTNTEEEGTPEQMIRIVQVIGERRPAAIFWESTGSDRYALSVSEDTGIPVVGPLYVDSVKPDASVATYIDMMRANARLIVDTLTEKTPSPGG